MTLNYQGHTERVMFVVAALGEEKVILGLPWLWEHNPEVDWASRKVVMS